MKTILLLTLGLTLTAVVLWQRQPKPIVPAATVIAAPARPLAARTNVPSGPAWAAPLPPREKFPTPWAALAAGDDAGFIALLREAGCPEETVRMFTLAALGRRYQQQAEAPQRAEARALKYWQTAARQLSKTAAEDFAQQLRRIRAEFDAEVARLLQAPVEVVRAGLDLRTSDPTAAWPPERRTEFRSLTKRHQVERRDLEAQTPRGAYGVILDDADRTALKAQRERQRGELAQLLGPEEAALHELRSSPEADYVRQLLPAAKDEAEFRVMVQAAREVGVESSDINHDSLVLQHVPAGQRAEFPPIQDKVLARFRELSDPERFAQLEQEQAAEQQRAEAERTAENEARSVADLEQFAKAGGVELSPTEARDLAAAIQRRGAELDREWGEPPPNPSAEQRTALEAKLKLEFERVVVSVVGEKGRALVEQMIKPR